MMDAPCESCFPFCTGCLCPCCTAALLRREALNTVHPGTGLKHYQCFQGAKVCPCCCECFVNCSRMPCLRCPCWCFESFFCPSVSLSSSKSYLQHEYNIRSDPCDNRLIRFNNCLQCCSCVCHIVACITRVQAVESASHIFDLIACCVHSCTFGCMAAQVNDECEHRQSLVKNMKHVNADDVTGTK